MLLLSVTCSLANMKDYCHFPEEQTAMVDILDPPSLHQEHFPAEIDVYKVPHNRMKQLVSSITEKLPEIQVRFVTNIRWFLKLSVPGVS